MNSATLFDPAEAIVVRGAREHNLKNISLAIPRNQFVVVTGVSGSGKSTLAFDLLFAEGQHRFLDSMNAYARQFVEQLARPDVDSIEGIPPTVSIEQRDRGGGGKSTVATVTEIYHFLRLLFAKLGVQHCPDCGQAVEAQTRDELGRRLLDAVRRRGELLLLAPVVKGRKGFHTDVAEWAARHGYAEIRADGKFVPTSERLRLDRFREHTVEIVTGILEKRGAGTRKNPQNSHPKVRSRNENISLTSPHQAINLIDETLRLGDGTLLALDNFSQITIHSTERACPSCGRAFEPLDPKNFSYNSPAGWCPKCRGFGELFWMPEDVDRGARADAIEESWYGWMEGKRQICPECHGSRLNPVARAVKLPADIFKSGVGDRRGAALLEQLTPDGFSQMAVDVAAALFRKAQFTGRSAIIARDILPEIRERLRFLEEVGLGYLQLGRGVPTLSGGESQRIRLAAQLGSNLSGVLYILDEPTIGLHARDNEQLLAALSKLRARGNSVLVVEHDEATMRRADHVIDLGPGAGVHGGEVVASGTLDELERHAHSVTGKCLRERRSFPSRGERRLVSHPKTGLQYPKEIRISKSEKVRRRAENRAADSGWLAIHHASKNNLKDLSVQFPLARLVLVTGVSGSGKSTLIRECLLPALTVSLQSRHKQHKETSTPLVTGFESVDGVHEVDQSPIGRTPRSTPATYVGFFDEIRALFAQVPEARLRGYGPGRFSFNSPQGRCPECDGAGQIKLEMNFLPPAFVPCESCKGLRFIRETLDIQFSGKNIAQVLEMSVEEALEFFAAFPKIRRPLQALHETGLDYLKLGQTSPTLSGGEAQRIKLVTHLLSGFPKGSVNSIVNSASRQLSDTQEELTIRLTDPFGRRERRNLFVLEEPTIGLHMADVQRLVEVLQRLVDARHSVIVIEHNLDLIAEADWIIDLGPEGGDGGGRIVAEGTPEQIANCKSSHTGRYLRELLSTRKISGKPGKRQSTLAK